LYDTHLKICPICPIERPYGYDLERECGVTHKNTLQILASNPPKCQSPLLGLYYKESKKLLLKKGGNLMNDYLDYMDEIYEELVEEFGHEIESVCEHNHTNA